MWNTISARNNRNSDTWCKNRFRFVKFWKHTECDKLNITRIFLNLVSGILVIFYDNVGWIFCLAWSGRNVHPLFSQFISNFSVMAPYLQLTYLYFVFFLYSTMIWNFIWRLIAVVRFATFPIFKDFLWYFKKFDKLHHIEKNMI